MYSRKLTDDERRGFLLSGTHTAKVGTVRKDGRPHVTPVGFMVDGDDIVFVTSSESIKGRTLKRDPRVSVCVDLEGPPYTFVKVDGVAEIGTDPDELAGWKGRLAERYPPLEEETALVSTEDDAYNRISDLVVRVRPEAILAVTYEPGEGPK